MKVATLMQAFGREFMVERGVGLVGSTGRRRFMVMVEWVSGKIWG